MIKSFTLSIVAMLGFFLNSSYADLSPSGWKHLYACQVTKCISKLIFKKNTIYAFTANEGLLKSTDAGSTWTTLRNGLPTSDIQMVDLVGDEDNHLILSTNTSKLYEWDTIEQRWTKVEAKDIPAHANMTSMVEDSKGTLYASFDDSITTDDIKIKNVNEGVYKSIDNGIHWVSLQLKQNIIQHDNSEDASFSSLSQTKLILDDKDNLYIKGKVVFENSHNYGKNSQKYFVYQLPQKNSSWIDTGYAAADIFRTSNGLLGVMAENGDISIKDIQYSGGQINEKKSWTFSPPERNSGMLIAAGQNNMYLFSGSHLYLLRDINNGKSNWELVANGTDNILTISFLAIYNNRLYSAGVPISQNQLLSSIDIFE